MLVVEHTPFFVSQTMPSRLKRGRKHGLSTYDGVRDVAYLHTECLKGQINDGIDHGAHLYCETTTTDLTAACSPAPVTDWSSGIIKVALVHKNGARTTIGCMYNLCEVTRSVLTAYPGSICLDRPMVSYSHPSALRQRSSNRAVFHLGDI